MPKAHTTSYPPLFGIVGDFETVCGGGRCENYCNRLSVSSKRQIIALFTKRNSAASGPTKISAHRKSRDLQRTTGFACDFIVTAYAPSSTRSPASATRNSPSRQTLNRLRRSNIRLKKCSRTTILCTVAGALLARAFTCRRAASNASQSLVRT